MKIRNGFVSNSSSTSFSVYGIYVDDEGKILGQLIGEPKETKSPGCKHKFDRDNAKFCPECGEPSWNIEIEEVDACDALSEYFKPMGIDVRTWSGGENCNDGIYVGKNLQSGSLNESKNKLDILREVEKKLKEIFPDKEPEFYSDGGYNG